MLAVSFINFVFTMTTCYYCSLPKANTSALNRLFNAFNLVMILNAASLVYFIVVYTGQSVENWFIGLEILTLFFCSIATCTWASLRKDAW